MKRTLDENAIRRMTIPFELKAMKFDDSSQFAGEFSGYAAGIHNIDRVGDMICPGAFVEGLPDFLNEGVVCWQHDWMTPIGAPISATEDDFGLMTTARISKTQQGLDAMTLIRDRVIKKLSIGYRVQVYEWVDRAGLMAYLAKTNLSEQRRTEILRQYDEMDLDELFLLKKIKLYEYSPVSVPANPNAIITDAKGLLAGLSFGEQLQAVQAAVKEITTRAKQISDLRARDNRKLSRERIDSLSAIAGELRELAIGLEGLGTQEALAKSTAIDEARGLYAEYLRIEAQSYRAA